MCQIVLGDHLNGENNSLMNKPIWAMLNRMVSMAMHNALLKNEDVPTKVLISQQQLIQNFKLGTN